MTTNKLLQGAGFTCVVDGCQQPADACEDTGERGVWFYCHHHAARHGFLAHHYFAQRNATRQILSRVILRKSWRGARAWFFDKCAEPVEAEKTLKPVAQ